MNDQINDFFQQAFRGSLAVAGAVYAAWTLNQVVGVLTALYIVVQAAYLLRKWWREEKDWALGRRKTIREPKE